MTWTQLWMSCPACVAKGWSPGRQTTWIHADCGGVMEVSAYAKVWCPYCGLHTHIMHLRWGCPNHGNPGRQSYYLPTTIPSLAAQMSVAAAISPHMGRLWLLRFLDHLEDW